MLKKENLSQKALTDLLILQKNLRQAEGGRVCRTSTLAPMESWIGNANPGIVGLLCLTVFDRVVGVPNAQRAEAAERDCSQLTL